MIPVVAIPTVPLSIEYDIIKNWDDFSPKKKKKRSKATVRLKGGEGSGDFGHAGRPGLVGGALPGKGASTSKYSFGAGTSNIDEESFNDPLSRKMEKYFLHGTIGSIVEEVSQAVEKSPFPLRSDIMSMTITEIEESGMGLEDSLVHVHPGIAAFLKAQNVAYLAAETGIYPEYVNETIANWAGTANDSNIKSLSMQEAVSEEFGVELSDWQKEQLDRVTVPYPNVRVYPAGRTLTRDEERAIVRTMYERTQKDFQDAGFGPDDMITIHRGMIMDEPIGGEGKSLFYEGNAMESWSMDIRVADTFANGSADIGTYGYIVSMKIPVKNILCTPRTGFGCWDEGEVVIFGSVPKQTAYISKFYDFEEAYRD